MVSTFAGYLFEAFAIGEILAQLRKGADAGKMERSSLALQLLIAVFATCAITSLHSYSDFGIQERWFLRLDQATAILRALVFIIALRIFQRRTKSLDPVVGRITISFAVYAWCALTKQVFDELAPFLAIPRGAYVIGDALCTMIWIGLLLKITFDAFWWSIRPADFGSQSSQLIG